MPEPDLQPAPPPRSGRFLRLALIASLALNLLFLGLIAGSAFMGPQHRGAPSAGPDLRALWRALPDKSREEMRAQFREGRGTQRPADREAFHAEMAEREAEMLALLRAEEFDATAFVDLLDARRRMMDLRAEDAQSVFVSLLATLNPAERAAVADRYEARRERRSRHR
ncbi:periplasmic heavy metal sensor [Pararhodobacter sp. SW119]|uniref:periplasmic heavy metal sensor n=1 Tax=Pararhodobacter sp. SW119 TaxID=2780075 RepID=UPI001AE0051F|nr:periplasmic heavy metal sensor [Pararhodobacter sp. SW119]